MPDLSFKTALTLWVAKKRKLDPALISDMKLIATEGHSYSTLTVVDFGCEVFFKYGEGDSYYSLDEREVVEFLTWVWEGSDA